MLPAATRSATRPKHLGVVGAEDGAAGDGDAHAGIQLPRLGACFAERCAGQSAAAESSLAGDVTIHVGNVTALVDQPLYIADMSQTATDHTAGI